MRLTDIRRLTAVVLVLGCLLLTACMSFTPDVYTPLNYSESDAVRTEMKRIDAVGDASPVEALWRSYLLLNSAGGNLSSEVRGQFDGYAETVSSLAQKAVAGSDYLNASRYTDSLRAVGLPADEAVLLQLEDMRKQFITEVPGFSPAERNVSEASSVSLFIDGTVTIWVDKGIKVERGMGFVDRVIGSGFFISSGGYIITNYHVIQSEVDPEYEGFSRLYIKLAHDPDTRIPAKVVGWDPALDLALLKTEVSPPYVFALGSSEDLDTGDRIYAIGSPVGLDRTLTSGIVSAKQRSLFSIGNAMQIDAAVNAGNSGGPIIDAAGNVQGIVFAGIAQFQGLNFAIPVEYLKQVLPFLYNGGERAHPWMGAYGHTYKDAAYPDIKGVAVDYVMPGSSADRAGIKEGDVLAAVNGQPVTGMDGLHLYFMGLPPDTAAAVDIYRDGTLLSPKAVYLGERPEYPGHEIYTHDVLARAFIPLFGMELVSTGRSRDFVVSRVLKGSLADESGFSEQDPITVRKVEFSPENNSMLISIYAKKRKNGYLDVNLGFAVPLDSQNYF